MSSHCLKVVIELLYHDNRRTSTTMSTPGASVDLMVEACFKSAVFPWLNVMPTILLIDELVKAKCTGCHEPQEQDVGGTTRLPSPRSRGKQDAPRRQRPHAQLQQDGEPPFTHPDITPLKTVTEDKQLTNKHKVTWDEYNLQEAVIFHGRASIVAAVMPQ